MIFSGLTAPIPFSDQPNTNQEQSFQDLTARYLLLYQVASTLLTDLSIIPHPQNYP